ncbi:hypothetical protein [Nannocystis bainbridge]|uniref:Lipoprotein n=1 Tax=Nannocystis bainbridge TaxID=2995303 RepID=A0ABT5DR90_9BACT|nr:hypothetical protein [Nannocystis bainbridge]MDC0716174.1 hypothetical protein [Nannocystis bainbridge]
MHLRRLGLFATLALLITACGEDKDPLATVGGSGASASGAGPSSDGSGASNSNSAGSDSDGSGSAGGSTGDDPTSGGDPTGGAMGDPYETCQDYIACIAVTTPNALPDAQSGFGEGAMCWSGSPVDAELCGKACATGLSQYHEMFPDEPACDPCALGGECQSGAGTFLLAISTPLGRELPFQFIVEGAVSGDGPLALSVQSLSLDMSRVTAPRLPVGEVHMLNSDASDGNFVLATGAIMIPGEANPLFGVPVVVDAILSGKLVGTDKFCGEVTGAVVEPVSQPLDGSTFAAVRVPSASELPLDVEIDCPGQKVTDP